MRRSLYYFPTYATLAKSILIQKKTRALMTITQITRITIKERKSVCFKSFHKVSHLSNYLLLTYIKNMQLKASILIQLQKLFARTMFLSLQVNRSPIMSTFQHTAYDHLFMSALQLSTTPMKKLTMVILF